MFRNGLLRSQSRLDLIAIASFGGHLEELLQLSTAWEGRACLYVTTEVAGADAAMRTAAMPFALVSDCHMGQFRKMIVCLRQIIALVRRHRPHCVVTTGALPGLIMALVARLSGAQAIWVDSLANTDTLSGSGRFARWIVDRHLTQWPAVARRDGTQYSGTLF